MELAHFLLTFFISNVVVGSAVAALLLRYRRALDLERVPLTIIGFGLAPCLITLVLYYTLWLVPHLPQPVIVAVVGVVVLAVALHARAGFPDLVAVLRRSAIIGREPPLLLFLTGTLLAIGALFTLLHFKPLVDHDVLEYGVQGRIFLRDRAITYARHHFDVASGFYYVGLHGFAFPLLFTWEGLVSLVRVPHDAWVRSQTIWYAWLVIALIWSILRRRDPWLPVWATGALLATLGFLFMLAIYHLDAWRIFLFTASAWLLMETLRTPSKARLLLLGAICGAHAFLHSLGIILFAPMFLVLLFFGVNAWRGRLTNAGFVGVSFLVAGGVHYVIDVGWGTGWIFKDIIWF